jgi:hypothetical protein
MTSCSAFQPRRASTREVEAWEVTVERRAYANLALYHERLGRDLSRSISPEPERDRVRHRGVEVWRWQPCDWLEVGSSYTSTTWRSSRSHEPAWRAAHADHAGHRGSIGGTVFLPYGFELGVSGYYVGSRPLANDLPSSHDELPKFASYDARIGWSHDLGAGVSFGLDVAGYNLTDREYAEFGGVSLFDPTDLGFYPSPGRSYLAAVRLELRR